MNIALLGTGLIGYPMAERLLENGYHVTVFNRTTAKAQPLEKKGAHVAETPQEAIVDAECIVLVLSDHKAIEETLFSGDEHTLLNKTIIQMGTIAPSESIEIQKKVFKYGGEYFECPVLGSRQEASEGRLILMVGATSEKFQKWQKLLQAFGPNPRYIGEVGKAAALKLAVNQLIAAHAASFSLSLGLIEKNAVGVEDFMDILRESSLYAPMFDKKLNNWLNRSYANPNFPVKHLLKDVQLILQEAKQKDLAVDALDAIYTLLKQAEEKGLADKDYSSIFNIINRV